MKALFYIDSHNLVPQKIVAPHIEAFSNTSIEIIHKNLVNNSYASYFQGTLDYNFTSFNVLNQDGLTIILNSGTPYKNEYRY